MAELMSALSMASAIAEGKDMEHGVKSCYIALRVADTMKIADQERSDIYYTAFLQHTA